MVRVAIIPGNGAGDVFSSNWYGSLQRRLHRPPAVVTVLRNMPDPVRASERVWLPFMESELLCGEDTIIVGHSSGAAAAMRYAETHPVAGLVLVSAYTSDLGDANEAASGYFSRPWDWEAARRNAGFVLQFGSRNDPFLPWAEQVAVAEGLGAELRELPGRGHFCEPEFPELAEGIEARVAQLLQQPG